ncbi:hypothetical protein TrLO_g1310 [Triparma laevis f. longispina]|uniref:Uncharacterized protein n=1 Tax=Triparma laevis f. longispina TaxID=1714387 RepID=A0A9W7KS80_9STRA|nr:hypothetical protein TrLO_g1310 [Triparma laevis f. longispina]
MVPKLAFVVLGARTTIFPLVQPTRSFASNRNRIPIVLNHSTHLPSLLPFLRCLYDDRIKRIVPGRLSRNKSSSERFTVKVGALNEEDSSYGYRLLAREGTQVQEVFLTATAEIKRKELEAMCEVNDNRTSRREGKGKDRRMEREQRADELEAELRDATSNKQRAEIKNEIEKLRRRR